MKPLNYIYPKKQGSLVLNYSPSVGVFYAQEACNAALPVSKKITIAEYMIDDC